MIRVSPPIIARALPMLEARGLEFLAMVSNPDTGDILVMLGGDALPDACDETPRFITATVTTVTDEAGRPSSSITAIDLEPNPRSEPREAMARIAAAWSRILTPEVPAAL